MRASTLVSAVLLFLASSGLAAPVDVDKRQGGPSAIIIDSEQQTPPPAPAPCTPGKERRSWLGSLWRRQTIVAAHDCSFTLAQGTTARFQGGGDIH